MDARDRDFVIRTILGEAGNEPDVGKLAVAHAILNRVKSGKWGKTGTEVVLAPKQFEPWSTRAAELMMIDKASADYKRAGLILDMALTGMAPDPTNGATHFYAPKLQADLGRKPPKWAKGDGLSIGGHKFFPDPDAPQTGQDAIAAAAGVSPQPGASGDALAFTADGGGGVSSRPPAGNSPPASAQPVPEPGEVFRKWGVTEEPAAAAAAKPADIDTTAVFSKWGVQPEAPAPSPVAAASAVDKELERRNIESFQQRIAQPTPAAPPVPSAQLPAALTRIAGAGPREIEAITGLPSRIDKTIEQTVKAGEAMTAEGMKEMREGRTLPRFPSSDPSTWEAGGALKAAAGQVVDKTALLSAPIEEAIVNPITQLTGNPQAGALAGLMVPLGPVGSKAGKAVASKIGPETRAFNEIADIVPKEEIASTIARLEANPRLTLADINETARDLATGLAADARAPKAQQAAARPMAAREKTRAKELDAAFADLGQAPDVSKALKDLEIRIKDVGSKEIEPVLKATGPVDITSTIAAIDKEIGPHMVKRLREGGDTTGITPLQKELWDVRDKLRKGAKDEPQMFANAKGATTAQHGAHEIQSALRTKAEKLIKAGGSDELMGMRLMDIRNKLVQAIDDAGPRAQRAATPEETLKHHGFTDADIAGTDATVLANTARMLEKAHGPTPIKEGSYKPALSKYRDANDVQRAFEHWGDNLMTTKRAVSDGPDMWRARVAEYSAEELAAAQQGALAALQKHLMGVRNAAGTEAQIPKLNAEVAERIKTLFGEQKGQRLLERLRDEREMAWTENRVLKNSKTAHAQAAQKRLDIRDPDAPVRQGSLNPLALGIAGDVAMGTGGAATATMAGLSMMKGAATKKMREIGAKLDKARNKEVASLLTASGGPDNPVLAILRAQLPGASGGNKIGNLLRGAAGVPLLP